jgi:glycosyltransferase involved in cell wall biosynthesis
VPEIEPAPARRAPEREHLTVLFFGTLRRNKGVDVLLRAIATLRDRDDLRFVFAGRGFADVEQAVADAAAHDDRIVFDHGYVSSEAKDRHYRDADLVVLPYTEFASTSAVLCDAYSYRVPLVVADVGALGDSVRAEGTGWVVPPADADALAKALVEALADADGRRAAAASAAAVAAARTPARIGAQVRDLYERVVGARA